VLWILAPTLLLAGLLTLTVLANRLRRELSPTVAVVDRFGREHRVELTQALERLRAETERTNRRLSGN
jgi:hypothetical protein